MIRIATERVSLQSIKAELGIKGGGGGVEVGIDGSLSAEYIHAGFQKYGFSLVDDAENYEQSFDKNTSSGTDLFVTIIIKRTGEVICENVVQPSQTTYIITKRKRYRPCLEGRRWQDTDGFYWSRYCPDCGIVDGRCDCHGTRGY
jgi:hypothetical protein